MFHRIHLHSIRHPQDRRSPALFKRLSAASRQAHCHPHLQHGTVWERHLEPSLCSQICRDLSRGKKMCKDPSLTMLYLFFSMAEAYREPHEVLEDSFSCIVTAAVLLSHPSFLYPHLLTPVPPLRWNKHFCSSIVNQSVCSWVVLAASTPVPAPGQAECLLTAQLFIHAVELHCGPIPHKFKVQN